VGPSVGDETAFTLRVSSLMIRAFVRTERCRDTVEISALIISKRIENAPLPSDQFHQKKPGWDTQGFEYLRFFTKVATDLNI